MRDENISSDEMDQIFYELLADDEGHNLVHYVEVATIDGSQVRITIIMFTHGAWVYAVHFFNDNII